MSKPTTVEEYLATFNEPAVGLLRDLRRLCTESAPDCTEQLKWGHPAYVHPDGVIMFVFSGHANHANIAFTPSTKEAFDAELGGFQTGKGRLALPYGDPLPEELIGRMIQFRLAEYAERGVKWM
ncbi:MAG TPA: DUF1801 domain-containing protein [Beutenbergiaceae bacterium]|nr:DUF1801 domain-containing protein [Beutenbergiaceae bacterium]